MPFRGLPLSMPVSRVAAVVLLAALLAFPAAGANLVLQGNSPWDAGYPQNPQQYCIVVYEEPSEHRCEVRGNVQAVAYVRVRIVGEADVHVSVVDNAGKIGLPEQRAVVDCSRSCIHMIWGGAYTDEDWTMRVYATGHTRGFVQVSLESRSFFVDRDW